MLEKDHLVVMVVEMTDAEDEGTVLRMIDGNLMKWLQVMRKITMRERMTGRDGPSDISNNKNQCLDGVSDYLTI